jgi:ABC-type sugar transport system ATPase subunit
MLLLETKDLVKRFSGIAVVKGVDFDLRRGEVHSLCGENGAGKSTLIKIIGGEHADYEGTITIDGERVALSSPGDAKAHGIEIIQQELSLARQVSVAENIFAGRLPRKWSVFVDRKKMVELSRDYLKKVGLDDIDPLSVVEELSQHEAQLVEIAKALSNNPKILIMDEPTSALSREEVVRLFEIIDELKASGLGIVYISHHLSELFDVSDRISVMRDGKKRGTFPVSELTAEKLVELMVGRSVTEFYERSASTAQDPTEREIFRARDLCRYGFFHNVSFAVREHEVLGICGVAGSGRSEIVRSICGLEPLDHGEMFLNGNRYVARNYKSSVKNRIVYLSEDRKHEGLALRMSMRENLVSAKVIAQDGSILNNARAERKTVERYTHGLNIVPNSPEKAAGKFSGGNQQKILLAKWLATEPELVFLDEPTRGVDVGAKEAIHKNILSYVKNNRAAAVVISSDMMELIGLSDRIIILRNGHVVGEFSSRDVKEETLLFHANKEVAV